MSTHSTQNTHGAFSRLFPPPQYLMMPAVGIDISDTAIKHIMLEQKGGEINLTSYGKLDLPVDVIERGEIADQTTIVKLLTRLREEKDFTYVHLSLPEEHAYLFQMELPNGTRAEVAQMLEFHLKENVPIGADEAVFDYNIIRQTEKKQELNVSVYPAAIAYQYVSVFEEAGMHVVSAEIEGQATARALIDTSAHKPTLVIDLGRNDASLSISTQGAVTFTASLETGGDDFTRAIARQLNISFQEAERLKRKHGFTDTKASDLVYTALLPIIQDLAESIRKHLMYWQMHIGGTKSESEEVTQIILTGGNANMRGMAEYLQAVLEVPVEVGSVWRNVLSLKDKIPDIHALEALEYTTSVGLALRSIERSK